jgi:hypothetical protein
MNIVGVGALPTYTRGYTWFDAGLSWRANERVTLIFEGSNLSRTARSSYFATETRPLSNWRNDAQLSAAVTIRF